jgi:hypothetical protein
VSQVINAFARVGDAKAADGILYKMKEISNIHDKVLQPDTVCYTSVIDACK